MQLVAQRRLDLVTLAAVVLVALAILAVPVEFVPYALLVLAVAAIVAFWTARGNLLTATCVWFLAVICFDEEFWRQSIPLFFNATISRLLIVVLCMMWIGMWALGRTQTRWNGSVFSLMAAMLVFFTLSAAVSGFETVAVASVHYRLIGGYWFAFAILFVMLHAIRTERHLIHLLAFFLMISVYLTFTAWCEHFKVWGLVFPSYIADATKGIHWGRVRGPFLVSPTMGVALVFTCFSNVVLARQLGLLPKLFVYLLCILMLPAIFWTETRSAWLAMILATMVWFACTKRRWSRVAAICLLTALAISVFTVNVENILSRERAKGGVTDPKPLQMRVGLALITWEIFKDYPVAGVGFGHFRDEAPKYARQIGDEYYAFASSAMEHNNFLSLLAETGLIGLVLFVALLVVLLKISIRLYRRLPASAPGIVGRDLIVLYWTLFVVYIVDGMFRETSVHPFTNSLFFGISGLIVALDWLLRPQSLRLPGTPPGPQNGDPDRLVSVLRESIT